MTYIPYAAQQALTTDTQAVSVITYLTTIANTTAAPYAYTLASGVAVNQRKKIIMLRSASNIVVTGNFEGATTTITFSSSGQEVELIWSGLEWKTIANTASSLSAPYKKYIALLNQTSTNAPVPIVLENTLSGTPVWSYSSAGDYILTLANEFVEDKTFIIAGQSSSFAQGLFGASWIDVDRIEFATWSNGVSTNAMLSDTSIEIRVYP